ncbi:MAG: Ig-like domain-containing protein [Deltaproteobacteria bacterium]|nr:Ig-like domain-containing protein [Deltaproteobacteria bacterium]
MMRSQVGRFALGLFTVSLALPAAAMSPEEAAAFARQLGRPLPSYIQMQRPPPSADRPQLMYAPGGAPLPLYLNRHGGHYECAGFDEDSAQNHSSVVCNNSGGGSGDIGGFSGSDTQWNNMRDCVADLYSRFNVYVTDLEPTSGQYVEAVVGGSPEQAGMPWGVGGVAPYFCDVIPTAIVYAFADVYGNDMQGVCETVAQEISHAFGLDHEFMCEDPMTYLSGCGDKSFQDVAASCGEYEPRECSCGGTTQNSVQMMFELLGPSDGTTPPPPPDDREDPEVTLLSPDDGTTLQADSTITIEAMAVDDIGLSIVELQWDYSDESMFCPGEGGSWSCTKTGTRYAWSIQVGEGARTFRVHVRDVAGKEAVTEDRTIWLSADGAPRPDDNEPPNVSIASPITGARLPANANLIVVASIADDSGIARAELVWPYNDGAFPCPVEMDGITCTVDNNTYTWELTVGEGERSFSVRAVDLVGNTVESEQVTIDLVDGAELPEDDGNDTIDTPRELSCGDSIDVSVQDADWYVIDAPEGNRVTVAIDGEAASGIDLVATTGPLQSDVVTDGDEAVSYWASGDESVGVLPGRADLGSYTLTVECTEPADDEPAAPFACGQVGVGGAAWLGLLGLLRLRRRR